MFENLSDEALLVVWERTRRMLSTSADGPGADLPDYPEGHYRWHMAAEHELERRGFVEYPPGIWARPARRPVTVATNRG
jgi:hypothetical protein